MANWTLLHNDDLFDPNKEIYHQELYDISQVLVQEEDIESKILMGKNQMVAYHANSKFIRDYAFTPPSPRIQEENLDLEKHILRDGWNPYEIYFSNLYSYPNTVKDLEKIPDYLLIKPMKNIPENWETMYKSENYILLKIPK